MSVDLDKLPDDEEAVRGLVGSLYLRAMSAPIQNVLDALNLFRCRALFAEQELKRAEEYINHLLLALRS